MGGFKSRVKIVLSAKNNSLQVGEPKLLSNGLADASKIGQGLYYNQKYCTTCRL
jgi:hypothetical protein